MPKKHASAVLIILLLISITGTTFAQTQNTGVKEGDMYSYDVHIESHVPSLMNVDLLHMVAMRINVTQVNANEIKYQNTIIFDNGTESTTDGSEPISKENPYVNWYLFYPANLNANDTVPIFGGNYQITETVLRDYAGVERETNYLVIELDGLNESSSLPEYTEYYTVYFDKKTGVAVELYIEQVDNDEELMNAFTLTLSESNVWVVPEFPSIMAISILMITVLAGLIIYKKLRRCMWRQLPFTSQRLSLRIK